MSAPNTCTSRYVSVELDWNAWLIAACPVPGGVDLGHPSMQYGNGFDRTPRGIELNVEESLFYIHVTLFIYAIFPAFSYRVSHVYFHNHSSSIQSKATLKWTKSGHSGHSSSCECASWQDLQSLPEDFRMDMPKMTPAWSAYWHTIRAVGQ